MKIFCSRKVRWVKKQCRDRQKTWFTKSLNDSQRKEEKLPIMTDCQNVFLSHSPEQTDEERENGSSGRFGSSNGHSGHKSIQMTTTAKRRLAKNGKNRAVHFWLQVQSYKRSVGEREKKSFLPFFSRLSIHPTSHLKSLSCCRCRFRHQFFPISIECTKEEGEKIAEPRKKVEPNWPLITKSIRGSQLQTYFSKARKLSSSSNEEKIFLNERVLRNRKKELKIIVFWSKSNYSWRKLLFNAESLHNH